MSTVQVFTAICLLLAHSVTVSASATFLYPTGGQIFDVRDTVVVEYQSTYKDPALALWYENSSCSFQPGAAQQLYAISGFAKADLEQQTALHGTQVPISTANTISTC